MHRLKSYKCGKITTLFDGTKKMCNWNGNLIDFIDHMIFQHKNSCFKVFDREFMYEWTIPDKNGEYVDKTLLITPDEYFLYHIYYRQGIITSTILSCGDGIKKLPEFKQIVDLEKTNVMICRLTHE